MPPEPPVARLPADWAPWEEALDRAIRSRLPISDSPDPPDPSDLERATQWHDHLHQVSYAVVAYVQLTNEPSF